jgi:hypothetical protein
LDIKAALNVANTTHHLQMGPCQTCAWILRWFVEEEGRISQ